METRTIGSLEVSLVGLGCNNFGMRIDEEQTQQVVDAAIDAGITLFDTADIYGKSKSEEFLGRALGSRRDEVIVATKFGVPIDDTTPGGAGADYVRSACDASLRRLGTDRIDLYQLHFPDGDTPIAETLDALNGLVEAGKVREIGCSNFNHEMAAEAAAASEENGWARFVSIQNQLSLLDRRAEDELLRTADDFDLGILPYFPLASGLLTGKYQRDSAPPEGTRLGSLDDEQREKALSDKRFDVVERLEAFAAERGRTILELAMSWLACLPNMASVIAGATKPEQVRSNAAAVGWKLTDDEMAEVADLAQF